MDMVTWPLPFADEVIDMDEWRDHARIVTGMPSIAARARKASLNPSTHTRAVRVAMIECKHQLPTSQCSHCNGNTMRLCPDLPYERKDYVQVFQDTATGAHDVNPEVEPQVVSPRDLYGPQVAHRIKSLERSE